MKFGILGDAKIAREKVIPAIRKAGHEVIQLGRRAPEIRASDPVYQGVQQTSYDDVLANPEIDIIYNPLPNHLHVPWSITAMEAGKHVICEKPIALNMAELDTLEAAARRTRKYIYEGFMIRHHPQWQWLQTASIGIAQGVQVAFAYPTLNDENIRNVAEWGGGPLYDIGCYAIMAGILVFGGGPESIYVKKVMDEKHGVENFASGLLVWPGNRHLVFSVSSSSSLTQNVHVIGTQGAARLEVPFNPVGPTTGYLFSGTLGPGEPTAFADCDQYALMIDDVTTAIAAGHAPDFAHSRIVTACLETMAAAQD
jgi:predicted dehydrogenase